MSFLCFFCVFRLKPALLRVLGVLINIFVFFILFYRYFVPKGTSFQIFTPFHLLNTTVFPRRRCVLRVLGFFCVRFRVLGLFGLCLGLFGLCLGLLGLLFLQILFVLLHVPLQLNLLLHPASFSLHYS